MNAWLLLASAGQELVPPRDELGLPGWVWLFQLLLPLTFALHTVFMNYVMGASVILPVLWGVGCRRGRAEWLELARAMVRVWPVAISMTITTGVAPLLFVQVLYGHFFYTANILLGWRWLAILGLLILLFYVVYVLDGVMQAGRFGAGLVLMIVVAAAVLMIAHEFTNNSVLMLVPERWRAMYDGVTSRHARHPMWAPRMVHVVVGALAVTGLWIAGIGRTARSLSEAARRGAVVMGLRLALIATALQIVVGLWFFVALDSATQKAMFDFSSPRAWLWSLAVVAGISSLVLLWKGCERPDHPRSVWLPVGLIAFVLLGMSAGRETVRIEMLSRVAGAMYGPGDVRLQAGPLAMFLVTLVAGLGVIGLMLWWLRGAMARQPDRIAPQ